MTQVTVTRTFIVPEAMKSVNELEQAVLEFGRQLMRELIVTNIRLFERNNYRCGQCRSYNVEPRGTKPRNITLVFGEIELQRARVFCRECETFSQPADALLDELEGGHVTHSLREMISLSAASWGFQEAQGVIERLCGVKVSHETIRQLAYKEAERVIEEETRRAAETVQGRGEADCLPGKGYGTVEESGQEKEFVCIEMDGGYVHSRENQGGMEGKVGLIYSKREKVGKDRYKLSDKRLVATFAGSERLGRLCYVEAKAKGVELAKRSVVLGDGAAWIWKQKEEHLPGAKAILDLYHLKREVWDALGSVELPGRQEGIGIIGRGVVEALEHGGVDEACGLIAGLVTVCEAGKEELSRLLEYIRNNREAIPDYVKLSEEGYPVGSGAVEKQVDLVINRRMKGKRGMRWTRAGADALGVLRVLWLNGDWASYWEHRRHHRKVA